MAHNCAFKILLWKYIALIVVTHLRNTCLSSWNRKL